MEIRQPGTGDAAEGYLGAVISALVIRSTLRATLRVFAPSGLLRLLVLSIQVAEYLTAEYLLHILRVLKLIHNFHRSRYLLYFGV